MSTDSPTTKPSPRPSTARPAIPRTFVVDNGIVDVDGTVRRADETVENCGSMQTITFTLWVRYDNGDLARYVYSIVPNPDAIPTKLWRFDPSGLPLAHPMISDFDPGLPFMRCSAY